MPEYRFPRDGTIRNIRGLVRQNSFAGPAVVTLFVDGAATSLSATIPAGSTASFEIPGSISVSGGQRVAVKMDLAAAVSGIGEVVVSYETRLK